MDTDGNFLSVLIRVHPWLKLVCPALPQAGNWSGAPRTKPGTARRARKNHRNLVQFGAKNNTPGSPSGIIGLRRKAGVTVHATHAARCRTGRANSISKNKPAYEM